LPNPDDVVELGELVNGKQSGRTGDDQRIFFCPILYGSGRSVTLVEKSDICATCCEVFDGQVVGNPKIMCCYAPAASILAWRGMMN
jgi:hypothetical protein